jgi:hypothetical protein
MMANRLKMRVGITQ